MTPQQVMAITYPCEQPMQCSQPQYRSVFRASDYLVCTVLTVNIGDE